MCTDPGEVMRRLLHYPPVEDINVMLNRALQAASKYREKHPKTFSSKAQVRALVQSQLKQVQDTLQSLLLEYSLDRKRMDEVKILVCIDTLSGLHDYVRDLV